MTLRALWPLTQQFQNKNGSNLVSGKVYIYYQGRTALATTYHDEEGTVVNANPVLLDNNGRATVFADTIYSYTIVVCDYYGKELFSQDITLHDAISTAKDIVILGSDGSVKVDKTELPNGVQYDLSGNKEILATKEYVNAGDKNLQNQIDSVKEDVNEINTSIQNIDGQIQNINTSLENKKNKQNELNFNGSATKTVKKITQYPNGEMNVEFEDIDLPQEVPNVEITSEDKSIKVSETTDVQTNTKKFDLSVNIEDAPIFGRFVANNGLTLTKTEGNMTLSSDGKIQLKKGKGYHFTIRGNYYNDTLYNDLRDISFIEYSRNENIPIIVDGTLSTSQAQPFEISFDVAQRTSDLNYGIAFSGLTQNGHITGLIVEVHDINSVSVNSGSYNNLQNQIYEIEEELTVVNTSIANKKDRQNVLTFNGSASKTIKNIEQNENGELNVVFEDINIDSKEWININVVPYDSSIKFLIMNAAYKNGLLFFNGSINKYNGKFNTSAVNNLFYVNGVKLALDFRNYYGSAALDSADSLFPCAMGGIKDTNLFYIYPTKESNLFYFNAVAPVVLVQ